MSMPCVVVTNRSDVLVSVSAFWIWARPHKVFVAYKHDTIVVLLTFICFMRTVIGAKRYGGLDNSVTFPPVTYKWTSLDIAQLLPYDLFIFSYFIFFFISLFLSFLIFSSFVPFFLFLVISVCSPSGCSTLLQCQVMHIVLNLLSLAMKGKK